MREYNEFEKEVITQLVSCQTSVYNIVGHAKKIFRNTVKVVISGDKTEVRQLIEEGDKWKEDKTYLTSFMKLQYFIMLLHELERDGLVLSSPTLGEKFSPLNANLSADYSEPYAIDAFYQSELKRYFSSNILVNYQLVELVKNDFKTPEQIRFDTQLGDANKKHKEAMKIAKNSVYISWAALFITTMVSVAIPLSCDTNIHEDSIDAIDKIIQENKTTIPQTINTNIVNDTLKVDVVKSAPNKR